MTGLYDVTGWKQITCDEAERLYEENCVNLQIGGSAPPDERGSSGREWLLGGAPFLRDYWESQVWGADGCTHYRKEVNPNLISDLMDSIVKWFFTGIGEESLPNNAINDEEFPEL